MGIWARYAAVTGRLFRSRALWVLLLCIPVLAAAVFLLLPDERGGAETAVEPDPAVDPGPVVEFVLADEPDPDALEAIDDSRLEIVQITPTGEIDSGDLARSVTVVFNHPMRPLAPLEQDPEAVSGLFQIAPEVPGRYRWMGSRTQIFIPDEGFTPGAAYTVTVPRGATALNGMVLEQTVRAGFKSPALKIESVQPRRNNRIEYEPAFALEFNYPVDPEMVADYLELEVEGELVALDVRQAPAEEADPHRLASAQWEAQRRLQVHPRQSLPRDAEVRLRAGEGLPPREGSRGLQAQAEYRYRTYGPLRVSLSDPPPSHDRLWHYSLRFNNPVPADEIREHVRFSPRTELVRDLPEGVHTGISLRHWALAPLQDYTITIDPAIRDRFGNQLESETELVARIPGRARLFSTESGFLTLERGGPTRTPVEVAAIDSLDVETGALTLDTLREFAHIGLRANEAEFADSYDETWSLNLDRTQAIFAGYELAEAFERSGNWLGVRVEGVVEQLHDLSETTRSRTHFLQYTDLGLTVKEGHARSLVWLHSMSGGQPLAGATVRVWRDSGEAVSCETDEAGFCAVKRGELDSAATRRTLYVAEYGDDRAFVMGRQRNHTRSSWGPGRTYRSSGGLPSLRGQVVFDRKLYRPGDTVYYRANLALRQGAAVDSSPAALGQIRRVIKNSEGSELEEQLLDPSEEGGVYGSFEIPEGAPLGHYTISFESVALAERLGEVSRFQRSGATISDTFQVEEFRPVRFTVDLDGFVGVTHEPLVEGVISGRYLFGAPMRNAPFEYALQRRPANLRFRRFEGYLFGDGETAWRSAWSGIQEADGELGGGGHVDVSLKLEAQAEDELPDPAARRHYEYEIEARVEDVDARYVTQTARFRVTAGSVLPGLRIDRRYRRAGDPFEVAVAAATTEGEPAARERLELVIHRKEWKTIASRGPGRSVQRRNQPEYHEIVRRPLDLDEGRARTQFAPEAAGAYTISVIDPESGAFARQGVHVYGEGFFGFGFSHDDEVGLLLDASEYAPGDTARLLIQSPFKTATAIVTIEREDVLWKQSFEIDGNAEPIEIPVTEDYIPNAYVGVTLIRPRVADDTIPPELLDSTPEVDLAQPMVRTGYARISVDTASRRLPLSIETDRERYSPGDPVELILLTEPGAEIAVSVADRAVLDLVDYRFRDPVALFYNDWPLAVRVLENRSAIMQQRRYGTKGDSPGGKGAERAARAAGGFDRDGEDGIRRDFSHTAHWTPHIRADREGRATLRFDLPDNLSTFRVQAVAAREGRYNKADHEFEVSQPITMQRSLPRFIRPGDRLYMGAVITNQTGREAQFRVGMSADLLVIEDEPIRVVRLEAGESREVSFPVTLDVGAYAARRQGSEGQTAMVRGELGVSVVNPEQYAGSGFSEDDLRDAMNYSLPVVAHPPREAFRTGGYTDTSVREGLVLPDTDQILGDLGGLELELSSTALIGLDRGLYFFRAHPYFCLEQRASAFLAGMAAGDLLENMQLEPVVPRGYDFSDLEALFLDELEQFRNDDGGFRAWRENAPGRSRPYLTAWVVFVLQAAAEANRLGAEYRFDPELYEGALDYLEAGLRDQSFPGATIPREQLSLIHYVLVRAGRADLSLERYLIENREHLSIRARAYLLLSLAVTRGEAVVDDPDAAALLEDIRNRMDITATRVSLDTTPPTMAGRVYYARGSTMALATRAIMAVDPHSPLLSGLVRQAIADEQGHFWADSHSVGNTAYTLWRYHQLHEKRVDGFGGRVMLDGEELMSMAFDAAAGNIQGRREIDMPTLRGRVESGRMHPLDFIRTGDTDEGRLYYQATLRYSPLLEETRARDEGIEIHRQLLDLDATDERAVVDDIERGNTLLVRLVVITPRPLYEVVIDDPIPSATEIVNVDFATEGRAYSRLLASERREYSDAYWWMSAPARYEYRDDRAVITRDYLSPGVHEFFYLLRGTTRGTAGHPAARVYPMYEPDIFGRTGDVYRSVH